MNHDLINRREVGDTGQIGKSPPSAVLSFAGPMGAGKTTVSTIVAAHIDAPRIGFGDYLRGVAREKGLSVTRETLQTLGEQMLSCGVRAFCQDVLSRNPWQPGRPLVIDGVRHVEVLDTLNDLLAPARNYLVYIDVNSTTQAERLNIDDLARANSLEELERHPTECQVRTKFAARAALILDGTQSPCVLAQGVIEFFSSKAKE